MKTTLNHFLRGFNVGVGKAVNESLNFDHY